MRRSRRIWEKTRRLLSASWTLLTTDFSAARSTRERALIAGELEDRILYNAAPIEAAAPDAGEAAGMEADPELLAAALACLDISPESGEASGFDAEASLSDLAGSADDSLHAQESLDATHSGFVFDWAAPSAQAESESATFSEAES